MTLFKMRLLKPFLLVLAASAYLPGAVWACQEILESSPHLMDPAKLSLPREENLIREIADYTTNFIVHAGNEKFWTIVFDPRRETKNEGYLIEGHLREGQYQSQNVRRTTPEDEKDYFKTVARLHGLEEETIVLNRNKAKCESVRVNAWIAAKLWLKHGLSLKDVKSALETKGTERVFGEGDNDKRHEFQSRDRNGNIITVVLAEKRNCPNVLVTAFEEKD